MKKRTQACDYIHNSFKTMQSIDSLLSNYIKNDTDSLDVFTCPHCSELPVSCLPNLLQDFPNCQMIRLRCPKGSKPCNRQSYFVCVDCKKRYQRLKPAEKHYEKNHTPPSSAFPRRVNTWNCPKQQWKAQSCLCLPKHIWLSDSGPNEHH